jgi:SAM-dependent methyltransferase
VRLTRTDMLSLELGRRFDVVTCLFSAIGVMRTLAQLRRALARMARHLEPGGLLVVEPWLRPGDWIDGHVSLDTAREGAIVLARSCVSSRRGRLSRLDFGYLVAGPDGTRSWQERHELRLSTVDELVDAATRVHLDGTFREAPAFASGRGLLVGTKPL